MCVLQLRSYDGTVTSRMTSHTQPPPATAVMAGQPPTHAQHLATPVTNATDRPVSRQQRPKSASATMTRTIAVERPAADHQLPSTTEDIGARKPQQQLDSGVLGVGDARTVKAAPHPHQGQGGTAGGVRGSQHQQQASGILCRVYVEGVGWGSQVRLGPVTLLTIVI